MCLPKLEKTASGRELSQGHRLSSGADSEDAGGSAIYGPQMHQTLCLDRPSPAVVRRDLMAVVRRDFMEGVVMSIAGPRVTRLGDAMPLHGCAGHRSAFRVSAQLWAVCCVPGPQSPGHQDLINIGYRGGFESSQRGPSQTRQSCLATESSPPSAVLDDVAMWELPTSQAPTRQLDSIRHLGTEDGYSCCEASLIERFLTPEMWATIAFRASSGSPARKASRIEVCSLTAWTASVAPSLLKYRKR